ncbi:MAG: type I-E CRISPR-associated protein Cas5/CasD [Candidatus Fermentibacteraceae bacterium]|nr:type I-E CRISPR-associated protein Cas5/CasD [Candidatus Fermentibacteraceae bacterium]MBN2609313.1 type I-E CRISPR-associated protein Cas5/CasD [Candidatus Fermentibacteraceae bacterium]
MKTYLILRFDAPLMSFGTQAVDNYGRTERFPSLSALTGLVANALGLEHRRASEIQRLQSRLQFAVRCDRPGRELRDFQTVDMGQDFMHSDCAWTTWSYLDGRRGGSARESTHIRYRDYLTDAIYTVSLGLDCEEEQPNIKDVEMALIKPARPLFIGRKSCLPASMLLFGSMEASSPLDVLQRTPLINEKRRSQNAKDGIPVWWSPADGGEYRGPQREIRVTDQRDWSNQIHSGQRLICHGILYLKGGGDD